MTSISAYAHMKADDPMDIDGMSYENAAEYVTGELATASQELRLAGKLTDQLSYLVGASYAWYEANETSVQQVPQNTAGYALIAFGPERLSSNGILTDANYNTKSIFSSFDYRFNDSFTGHAGVRYSQTLAHANACSFDNDDVYGPDFTGFIDLLRSKAGLAPIAPIGRGQCFSANPVTLEPGLAYNTLKEHNVPFRVGLDWTPFDRTLVYVNVSRGFKGGSFPIVPATAWTQFAPAKQEQLTAYELGLKATMFDRRVQFNSSFFYYDYLDKQFLGKVILTPNIFGPLAEEINIPKTHILGSESQLTWVPLDGLTVNMALTYLDSRIDGNYSNYTAYSSALEPFTGEAFPFTPKWSGTASLDYKWAPIGTVQPFVGATLQERSSVRFSLGTIASLGASDPNLLLGNPGYALLDLRAGVQSEDGRWRVMAWGHNVTDKYYRIFAGASVDTWVARTGMPATYGITVSYRN